MNTIKFLFDNNIICQEFVQHFMAHNHLLFEYEHNHLLPKHRFMFKTVITDHEFMQSYHSAYILQELKMNSLIDNNWRFINIPDNGNKTKYIPDGLYINHYTNEYMTIQYKARGNNTLSYKILNDMIKNHKASTSLLEVGFFDNYGFIKQIDFFNKDKPLLIDENYVNFRDYSFHTSQIYDEYVTKNLLHEYSPANYYNKYQISVNEYKSHILNIEGKGNPHKYTCNVLGGDSLKIMETFQE